ncbi:MULTISPECIES: hypothetical protein [unclassified Streptomyces]|uniref:hypothetical protein n=1 Tax=unclassified Streptomyces TaxID=2593676 RepID=UPI0036E7A1E6
MFEGLVHVPESGSIEDGINGSFGAADAVAADIAAGVVAAEALTGGSAASAAPRRASTVRRGAPGPRAGRSP